MEDNLFGVNDQALFLRLSRFYNHFNIKVDMVARGLWQSGTWNVLSWKYESKNLMKTQLPAEKYRLKREPRMSIFKIYFEKGKQEKTWKKQLVR